ncbi:MAG: hypothetical protein E7022_04390 [Desulfovibrio desulfuricans]|nr:hypothetical protein [Desulfovibrio desulfuricans]
MERCRPAGHPAALYLHPRRLPGAGGYGRRHGAGARLPQPEVVDGPPLPGNWARMDKARALALVRQLEDMAARQGAELPQAA